MPEAPEPAPAAPAEPAPHPPEGEPRRRRRRSRRRATQAPDGPLRPVVVQDAATGEVLMLGYADGEALRRTLAEGVAWFYSRSRRRLWRKGETSGHTVRVQEVRLDCDGDALLYRGVPAGPVCHTGERSCFYRRLRPDGTPEPAEAATAEGGVLERLAAVIRQRIRQRPKGSYTAWLAAAGPAAVARKVGEEAVEALLAALAEGPARLAAEAADLVYHLLVLLEASGAGAAALGAELGRRLERGAAPDDAEGGRGPA